MEKLKLIISLLFAGISSGISSGSLAANKSMPPIFESLDTNADGVISFVEFQRSDINALARLDTDQNNMLTLDEFLNARPSRGLRAGSRGNNANAGDDDDKFNERRRRMRERITARVTQRFHAMDLDNNGIVALDEFQEANFERMDRDGDGVLNAEELKPPRRKATGNRRGRSRPEGSNGGQSASIC